MVALRKARELWHKNMNQLVLLLSAISSTVDRGQYQAAQEQLDAAMLLAQRTMEAGRNLIDAGQEVQERIRQLQADPVISAIITLDPHLDVSLERFEGELKEKLRELNGLRQELREGGPSEPRAESLIKRQLAERILQGVDQSEYLLELARILGVEIPPQSLLFLPSKDLREIPPEE